MAEAEPRSGELTTTNYGWTKPNVADSDDAWGGMLNADLDGIDSTVHGIQISVPGPSVTTPVMDGTATVGTATTYAHADHVHPTNTTRAPVASPTFTGTVTIPAGASIAGYATTASVPVASTTTPVINGTAAVGTGTTWARADHVHPTDTTRAAASAIPIATTILPNINGAASIGVDSGWARGDHTHPTDTTRAAVTAIPAASSVAPLIDGVATVGTSTAYARADHIHPIASAGVQTLAVQVAEGTRITTITTPASLLTAGAKFTLPANYFVVGKTLRMRVVGHGLSSGSADQYKLDIHFGSVTIFSSQFAFSFSGSEATWLFDVIFTCRSVGSGTSATVALMGLLFGAGLAVSGGNTGVIAAPAAPPIVSSGFNSTVSNVVDVFGSIVSGATAPFALQVGMYILEALN